MSNRDRLLTAAAAFAVALGAPAAAASQAPGQQEPGPNVDELLERFPLGTEKVTEEVPPRTRPPATTFTLPMEDSGGTDPAMITASATAILVLIALAAGMIVLLRRRSPPAPAWSSNPGLALLYETLASANPEWDNYEPGDYTRRRPPVSEVEQDRDVPVQAEPAPGAAPPQENAKPAAAAEPEHVGVVERISEILQSAESAAAAIRQEATVKAEEIAQAAVKEGQAHLARVKEEGARIRNAAEEAAKEAQGAAESFGAKQRREAEQRVQQLLSEAEKQARATRQAAEEMARQIEAAARQREETLRAQVRPLETSLRRALDAFRGITTQLEELLGDQPGGEGETLVEVLSAPVRRGEWEETAQATQPEQQRNAE